MSARCASCGAQVNGKFCSNCGTAVAPGVCPQCGTRSAAGARFCASCGTVLAGTPPAPAAAPAERSVLPMIVAGVAVLAVVVVLLFRSQPASSGPVPAGGAPFATGSGTPPDLSTMTPREQFDRLYERVMVASEQGDTATANQFAPMALMAYRNLGPADLDADSRFHAAMIRLHSGDIDGARVLADSILAADRTHLFGYIVLNGIGRFEGDQALVQQTYRDFLAAVEPELRTGRPEYQAHQTMIGNFQQAARAAGGR